MSTLPSTCRAAVFVEPHEPLVMQDFPLPTDLPDGAALVRLDLSTICGSDLHTTRGRRIEPKPSILGHESVGRVVRTGGPIRDGRGRELQPGDRVTWTIMAFCGTCYFCERRLPQKCEHLKKYGHSRCDIDPALTGGYAEYIVLHPGTTLFRVPDTLADEIVAPANCALATVVNAMQTIGVDRGEHLLIQGAGMLGIYLVALAHEVGARVLIADPDERRLEMARSFGADSCHRIDPENETAFHEWIKRESPARGLDVAIEVCGQPRAAELALDHLRIGGRMMIAGLVTPGSSFPLDGNGVTRRYLTIKGIHNYHPDHLAFGLDFLETHAERYPFADLVGQIFPLDAINEAMEMADRRNLIRVGIRCMPRPQP